MKNVLNKYEELEINLNYIDQLMDFLVKQYICYKEFIDSWMICMIRRNYQRNQDNKNYSSKVLVVRNLGLF